MKTPLTSWNASLVLVSVESGSVQERLGCSRHKASVKSACLKKYDSDPMEMLFEGVRSKNRDVVVMEQLKPNKCF